MQASNLDIASASESQGKKDLGDTGFLKNLTNNMKGLKPLFEQLS